MSIAMVIGGCALFGAAMMIDPLGGKKHGMIARARTRREAARKQKRTDRFFGV